jgi:hypothetical protein
VRTGWRRQAKPVPASEPAYNVVVICEAQADADTACGLADRILVEKIDWLEQEMLDTHRRWRGLAPVHGSFLKWAAVREESERVGLRNIFGHFQGTPGEPDAHMARRALLLLVQLDLLPDAVLLVRDSDGDARRRMGLEQARNDRAWPFEVIIGVAEPKRECWVLAGFDAKGPDESERLRKASERLSFPPVKDAHRLIAREHGAKTDAKVALAELTLGNLERERACLSETPLSTLEERGARTGLAAYLQEVQQRLVPSLGGRSPET